jgi:PKD repeat protein
MHPAIYPDAPLLQQRAARTTFSPLLRSLSTRYACATWLALLIAATPSSAAVYDFSAPLQNITASASPGGVVSLSVFDPALGVIKQVNVNSPTFDLVSANGIAAWSSGATVYCYIYDPTRTNWIANLTASGAPTFAPLTSKGVVAWSVGSIVHFRVYDQARTNWIAGNAAASGNVNLLTVADGVVAWSTSAGVGFRVYDPAREQWVGEAVLFPPTHLFAALINTNGVVAWSTSSGGIAGNIYAYVYDPTRTGWRASSYLNGPTFDLRNDNGVVAWSKSPNVFFQVYDPSNGLWMASSANTGFASDLIVSNSNVSWSSAGGSFLFGYNPFAGAWQANTPSRPLAYFAVSTNAGNAPLFVDFIDMSIGGASWSWNFDENGATSTVRSPAYRYVTFNKHNVTLTVTSATGISSSTNLLIRSDITAPSGTVIINGGASISTNIIVSLQLAATDNSGIVASNRFSNDSSNWSPWENFTTNKVWMLAPGNGNKIVYVQFSDLAGNLSAVASDTISLDTNPPPTVSFVSTNVSESAGMATIQVVLSRSHSQIISIAYSISNGTATAGSDYSPASDLLQFSPGTTMQSFPVTILPDNQVELNETVILNFDNVTNAVAGAAGTLTILDDDVPAVSFANATYNVSEAGGAASIAVRLNAASGQAVTVQYIATNGTALAGTDFVATNAVLMFPPGQTNLSFLVPILNDSSNELNETISLLLTNPVNATLAAPSSATLTIVDDEPPSIFFNSTTYYVAEATGFIMVNVWLNKPFLQDVAVNYLALGGTATPGVDYNAANGRLDFRAGETNNFFLVTILDNGTRQTDLKTVHLGLSNFHVGTPGVPVEADIVILDDEAPPRLIAPRWNSGQFQATLLGPTGQLFAIQISDSLTNWTTLMTLTNTSVPLEFTDSTMPAPPARFYRTVLGP